MLYDLFHHYHSPFSHKSADFIYYRVFLCSCAAQLKSLWWISMQISAVLSLCSFFCCSVTLLDKLQSFYNPRNLISNVHSFWLLFHFLFFDREIISGRKPQQSWNIVEVYFIFFPLSKDHSSCLCCSYCHIFCSICPICYWLVNRENLCKLSSHTPISF